MGLAVQTLLADALKLHASSRTCVAVRFYCQVDTQGNVRSYRPEVSKASSGFKATMNEPAIHQWARFLFVTKGGDVYGME